MLWISNIKHSRFSNETSDSSIIFLIIPIWLSLWIKYTKSGLILSIDLIGVVPDDEFIITQTNKGEPVISNKKAPSGKSYIEISRRILGENIEISVPGRETGFFSKLKRIFSRK